MPLMPQPNALSDKKLAHACARFDQKTCAQFEKSFYEKILRRRKHLDYFFISTTHWKTLETHWDPALVLWTLFISTSHTCTYTELKEGLWPKALA